MIYYFYSLSCIFVFTNKEGNKAMTIKKFICTVSNWFSNSFKPSLKNRDLKDKEPIMKSDMKILIDNGHGKDTPGKRSPYSACGTLPAIPFYEYQWCREIARPVVQGLRDLGYDAEILVPEETDISLAERCNRVNKICKELGASNVILVSIHSNAAGNGRDWYKAVGWSAYTTPGKTKSDSLAECLYGAAEIEFQGRRIRTDKSDGDMDWEENFYILRKSLCPAVLTENFFYDNIDDIQYILSEEGRNAIIQCHIKGIIKYIETL